VLSCVGRGLCDELITRPKESHNVSSKIRNTKTGGQGSVWAVKATDDDDDDDDEDDDITL
jgi:hypothetical protein